MPSNATETIDARILRLIGLEDVFDLDYDTYLTLLKEAAVKGRMPKTEIPIEEVELLTDELKRVKSKKDKGRFKVKKKKITATTLKTGGGGTLTGKKTSIPVSRLLPAAQEGGGGFNLGESFAKIAESVISIAKTLTEKKKLSDKESAFDRREDENERRKLQKENLKKRFAKMAAVAQKIIQPVKSLLDKILNYFAMIFFGRIAIKLLKWFTDPKNKSKVDAVGRFLGEHGPKLFGLWIAFGTGFGKAIRVLLRVVGRGIAKLIAATGKLAVAAGLKKFGGLSKFGGRYGQLLGTAVEVGGTLWAMNAIDNAFKGDEGEDTQGLANGGVAQKLPGFAGGGLFSGGFGNIFKKFNSKSSGDIVPGSGTGDTVSAMLTPGEAVLQVGARERQIEATGIDPLSFNVGPNANRPQMVDGTLFAADGGRVPGPGRESGSPIVPDWKEVGANVLNWVARASGEGYKMFGGVTDWIGRASGEGYRMFGGAKDWIGRAAGEGKRMISPSMDWIGRAAGEGKRMISPAIDWVGRAAGEGKRMISPTINQIIEVVSGIPGGIYSLATDPELTSSVVGFADAGAEAVPAILAGFLGIERTDRSISPFMQRGILEAAKRAGVTQGGNKNIDYGHYGDDAGGIAGKYTMGRIGANEFKYDSKGNIIGLRQGYDTNRPANESMIQATIAFKRFFGLDYKQDVDEFNRTARKRMISEGMGKHFNPLEVKGGKFQMGDIKTALYKPFEALLDISQKMHGGRGSTTHDIDFSENVLGFKPEEARIAPQPKPNTAPPPPGVYGPTREELMANMDNSYTAGAGMPSESSNTGTSLIDALIVNPFNSLKGAILGFGG